MVEKIYFKYWGKARREGEEGAPYHLLPYHCLDVAAVAAVLLREHKALGRHLQNLSNLDEKILCAWLVFCIAIHDLGKFSESFQNLRPDLLRHLQGKQSNKHYIMRHDSLGWAAWQKSIRSVLLQKSTLRRNRVPVNGLDDWVAAVMGHHGTPPESIENDFDYFSVDDRTAAQTFVSDVCVLLMPKENMPVLPGIVKSKLFSWWLAGVAVLCDWLGSNSRLFRYEDTAMDLVDYWVIAKHKAEKALELAELLPAEPAPMLSLQKLFSWHYCLPTPLQTRCNDLPLDDSPQLFILEDVTGAGKTEAAVILLHRLLAQGKAEGVYFALPTMATANAMYGRMSEVYRRLYQEGSRPSLVLAHGARELSNVFRHSIVPAPGSVEEQYGDDTESASARCSAWLADNCKKALLAEVGVGTIDQALLAVLPSKHQSLRLLGLLGKVLIVDEVHACDAYVHTLLCALLKAHATAGGSAILLSATLPANQRQKLLDAFAEGGGQLRPKIQATEQDAYPLLTHFAPARFVEEVVPTRGSVKRYVAVTMLKNEDSVLDEIREHLDKRKCVCWIRNTVDDACEAAAMLKEKLHGVKVDLFHARFAMADRLAIEEYVLAQFGPDSTPAMRRGRVLVATQVVEQSLDLDFDFMISDLAPIDLLIQRAGRLRRHTRTAEGMRMDGEDQRGKAILAIHGPNPGEDIGTDWYRDHFPRAAGIYPNHAELWLTANLLKKKGGFAMPADARELIEGVYGEAVPYPDVLQEKASMAQGEAASMRSVAMLNILKLDQGYNRSGDNCWWDDAVTPTRLGEESITVYLARWQGERITPWAVESTYPWPNSSVQMRRDLVFAEANDDVPQEAIEKAKLQLPAQGRWGILLVLKQNKNGGWTGKVTDKQSRSHEVEYSQDEGLKVEK